MESWVDVRKAGMTAVLVGDDDIGRRISPIYAKARIIPSNASLALGSPVIRYFVDYLAIGLQRNVAMRKTRRDPQLLPICRGKLQCDMATISGRLLADVDGNVHDGPPNAPYQF